MTKWLSVERAAELYAESAKIADFDRCKRMLLEAVLNDTLKISVRFAVPVKGKKGGFKRHADLDGTEEVSPNLLPYSTSPPSAKNSLLACIGLRDVDGVLPDFEDLQFAYESPTLLPIAGVWDLPLFGNGCYYVEELLDKNFETPEMSLVGAIYVQDPKDRSIYELRSVETYTNKDGQEDTIPVSVGELPKGATIVFRQEAISEFLKTVPASQLPSKSQQETYAEESLRPEDRSRLESEGREIDDLSPSLQDELKKLMVGLAQEKPGTVNNILLIGDPNTFQLKTFLAATITAVERHGPSIPIKQSTGADDLVSDFERLENVPPKENTLGVGPRRFRHWVILELDAFPFNKDANNSRFAKIADRVRIVATTSPDSQTPLPRGIEELFTIKVDFGKPAEGLAENSEEVAAVSDEISPDPNIKGGLAHGKPAICKIYGVEPQSYDNTVARKAKEHGRPIFHLDGPNGPPSMHHDDITFLKGTKHQRRLKK